MFRFRFTLFGAHSVCALRARGAFCECVACAPHADGVFLCPPARGTAAFGRRCLFLPPIEPLLPFWYCPWVDAREAHAFLSRPDPPARWVHRILASVGELG